MKVWDCFGAIYQQPGKKINRQLTTMSAAYAAETMPSNQMPQQGFQQMAVPMGESDQIQRNHLTLAAFLCFEVLTLELCAGQAPVQQMPMQTMPMQQMPMQTMPMQPMPQVNRDS